MSNRSNAGTANLYRVIRWCLVIILAVVIIVSLARKKESRAPFETVSASVSARIQSEKMERNAERFLKKYFGLNAGDYEGVLIYTPAESMFANEALLVKLKDTSQAEEVAAAIEKRIGSQLEVFEGYAPREAALLEDAVLDVQGNYILYIVDGDAALVDEVFRSSL